MFIFVPCPCFAFGDVGKFVFAELPADRTDAIGEHMCLQVVVLMEHDARLEVREGIRVLLEVFVKVADGDRLRTRDVLAYAGQ